VRPISVVIPTRNRPAMLSAAYGSLRRQTRQDFEVIISVNGKQATSLSEARRIEESDDRVKVLYNPKLNLSEAWNAGFNEAEGEMIHFLSDDDLLEPQFLETGCGALADRPELDLVGTDYVVITDSGETLRMPCMLTNRKVSDARPDSPTLTAYVLNVSIFRRRVLEQMDTGRGTFDPSFRIHGDEDFFVRLSRSEAKALHICVPLMRYRVHPGQATQVSLAIHFFEHIRVANSVRRLTLREATAGTIWAVNHGSRYLGTRVKKRIGLNPSYDLLPIDLLRYPELRP
jgi:glycosyltransferase involved in cell wall biosynthesis